MKILHTVQLYPPSVGGMQEVVRQISEHLACLGHEVYVATTKMPERNSFNNNGVNILEFDVRGNIAHGMTGEVEKYRKFVLNSNFDIMTNFAAQQWATDAIITELDKICIPKVLVPTGFSGLYDPIYRQYFHSMKTWMKKYDMNVFLSNNYRDINFARDNGVKNTIVIPNGASEEEFSSPSSKQGDFRAHLGIPKDHLLILTVGSHTGLKGHHEALKIFSKAKVKNSTLLIVANKTGGGCSRSCFRKCFIFNNGLFNRINNKQVIVQELSREDTVAAYMEADIFLFPSKIECSPLVIFEAMASRTPFLTADVGNAAEIIQWSGGGALLPTDKDSGGYSTVKIRSSAILLEKLLGNKDAISEMRKCGFNAWRNRFTWKIIASSYEKLYFDVVSICQKKKE